MLTTKQGFILKDSNYFVVKACPGAGKTYAVSYLIHNELNKGKRVLALSFTNVAKNEVIEKLNDEHELSLTYPHDVLTIDSFINKYIFEKYSYLLRTDGYRIIGEPITRNDVFGRIYRNAMTRIDIDYDLTSGKLKLIDNRKVIRDTNKGNLDIDKLKDERKRKYKQGFITQRDVNQLSLLLVDKFPKILYTIAKRFDVMIVDEAQDTSSLKMEIIDRIINAGMMKVVLIGDPDQSIYQWNDAMPELFIDKYNMWSDSFELNETRRCGEKICKVISKLSSHEEIISIQENDIMIDPKLKSYEDDDELQIIHKSFIEYCNNLGLSEDDIAVLYRSSTLKNNILGIEDEKPMDIVSKNSKIIAFLLGAKMMYDNHNIIESIELMSKFYLTHIGYDLSVNKKIIRQYEFENDKYKFRSLIMALILLLPSFADFSVKQWIAKTNQIFLEQNIDINVDSDDFAGKTKKVDTILKRIYTSKMDTENDVTYSTVHGVKGRTFKAVMVVLKKKPPSGSYKSLIASNNFGHEEMKILYVAMSRAADVLWLVVPKSTENIWSFLFDE